MEQYNSKFCVPKHPRSGTLYVPPRDFFSILYHIAATFDGLPMYSGVEFINQCQLNNFYSTPLPYHLVTKESEYKRKDDERWVPLFYVMQKLHTFNKVNADIAYPILRITRDRIYNANNGWDFGSAIDRDMWHEARAIQDIIRRTVEHDDIEVELSHDYESPLTVYVRGSTVDVASEDDVAQILHLVRAKR